MGGIGSGRQKSDGVLLMEFDSRQAARLFDSMLADTLKPFCWACGRDGSFRDKPDGWFSVWLIERAHLFSGNRIKDVRACVLLCSLCHKIQHGHHVVLDGKRVEYPRLTREHMLWLKRYRDPENYDIEFLRGLSIKKIAQVRTHWTPPKCYIDSYNARRGNVAA